MPRETQVSGGAKRSGRKPNCVDLIFTAVLITAFIDARARAATSRRDIAALSARVRSLGRSAMQSPVPELPPLRMVFDNREYHARPRRSHGFDSAALEAARSAWDAADNTAERMEIRRQRKQADRARARPAKHEDSARRVRQRRDDSEQQEHDRSELRHCCANQTTWTCAHRHADHLLRSHVSRISRHCARASTEKSARR